MKICFAGMDNLPVLAPEYGDLPIGGESVQQTLLARALARRGHAVSMVVADRGQHDAAQWDGIRVYKSYRPGSGIPVLRFVHPRWTRTWRALARANADVYYTSCAGMHVGLLALFCRRFGRRLVFRAASDPDCDRARLPVLIRHARDRALYRYGLRRADAILVQSSLQAETLLRDYGLASHVAGMLVDPATPAQGRDIDVLWVGNIKRVKRPDRMLQIAAKLPHVSLHVAGGETRGEEGLFREFTRGVACAGNIVFHGRLPYREASALYGRARILLNTSDVEGFPNAYLQAWQNGVPVVTLIDPDGVIGREGLGHAAKSAAELSDAIQSLLRPAAWHAVSNRCRAYMTGRYSEERVLLDYLDAFQAVMRSIAVDQRKLSPSRHHV